MKPLYLLISVLFITHPYARKPLLKNYQRLWMRLTKPNFFFTKRVNSQLEFERDSNGQITDVLLYFNNRKVPNLKIK